MTIYQNRHVRDLFPGVNKIVHLDGAASTPLSLITQRAYTEYLESKIYQSADKNDDYSWLERHEEVRTNLGRFFNVNSSNIAFIKNTSEGLNIVSRGLSWEPGDNILMLENEHPNNAYAWLSLRQKGLEVRQVPQNGDICNAETFAPYINQRTRAITLSHVMFHSGQRNDLASIGAFAEALGIKVFVDAVQSLGVIKVDLLTPGISAIVAGGFKGLLTPTGAGILHSGLPDSELSATFVSARGVQHTRADLLPDFSPTQLHEDARRFEYGGMTVSNINALNASVELIDSVGIETVEDHVLSLGDELIKRTDALGITLNTPLQREHRSSIYILNLPAEPWRQYLAKRNIRVAGIRTGVRVSFGIYSNVSDIDALEEALREGISEGLPVNQSSNNAY